MAKKTMRKKRKRKAKAKTRKQQFLYNPNNPKKSFDVYIDKLHIQLIDEYGMEIDMNYNDYSFALEFDILYEK